MSEPTAEILDEQPQAEAADQAAEPTAIPISQLPIEYRLVHAEESVGLLEMRLRQADEREGHLRGRVLTLGVENMQLRAELEQSRGFAQQIIENLQQGATVDPEAAETPSDDAAEGAGDDNSGGPST